MTKKPKASSLIGKSKVVAGWLGILLGGLGAHRFYLGQRQLAFLYILGFFLFGLSVLVGFVDGVRYLLMKDAKFIEELRGGKMLPKDFKFLEEHRGGATSSPELKQVPQIELKQPANIAHVSTEKFDFTLREKELKITRRFTPTTLKQVLDSVHLADDGEYAVDLNSIAGVKFTPATNDKLSFGKFSGRLVFLTSLDTSNLWLGTNQQGELEFDFSKSSEAGVKAFLAKLEIQREKLNLSSQNNPVSDEPKTLAVELRELAELRDSGVLTEEEFKEAKAKAKKLNSQKN